MSQYVSFVVQSWRDDRDATMRWKVCDAQDGDELSLPDASFVVRTWIDDDGQVIRGLIRHVQSGREMQFQSGSRAFAFVRAWLDGDLSAPIECDLGPLQDGP
jgi:hypothetical protein